MNNKDSNKTDSKYFIDAFFAGVGGIELGFKQTGKFDVAYANEFDRNARKTYLANNPFTNLDGKDIHEVNEKDLPDCDVIMGGFPCQSFSVAGYQRGFKDPRGGLFFEMLRMIKEKNPRIIFIENVKNLVTHDNGKTFKVIKEALIKNGYYIQWKVMNTKDYGNVPQNRERIYLVGFKYKIDFDKFEFPKPISLTTTLKDMVDFENKVDEKYYYSKEKNKFYDKLVETINSQNTIYQWRRSYVRENKSGISPALTATMGMGGHNVPLIYTDDKKIRKLTPRETFNLQGYPKDFKLPDIATGQLYKQAGNSVSVPVINRIAQNIVKVLDNNAITNQTKSNSLIGKYSLMYSSINSGYEGKSYVIQSSNSVKKLSRLASQLNIKLVDIPKYFKVIKKKKPIDFGMIE